MINVSSNLYKMGLNLSSIVELTAFGSSTAGSSAGTRQYYFNCQELSESERKGVKFSSKIRIPATHRPVYVTDLLFKIRIFSSVGRQEW